VTATFTLRRFTLTVTKAGNGAGAVTSNPAGINCGTTCAADFNINQAVTLTAAAATGSTFTGWSGGGCTGTGTCTVTITAATTVTATFTLQRFALTVTKAGNGAGTVTSNPAGISCGATCSASFNFGQAVTLTAAPATGSTFTGWSGGGCTGTGTCTTTIRAATSVTATFTLRRFTLTVGKQGVGAGTSTVTSNPAGISCGSTCAADYNFNQTVTLTATPDEGLVFLGWSGDCTGTGTCTVTMTSAMDVTATFGVPQQTLSVTMDLGSASGTVTSSPAGINCTSGTCSASFDRGSSVTLTATPGSLSLFRFWTGGGCDNAPGFTCTVILNGNVSVTAVFDLQPR
jgi:hypothetical protein